MKVHLPWVTLKGTPDGPGWWARFRCLGALLVHEAVEVVRGSKRAHEMPAAEHYGFEPVTASVVAGAIGAEVVGGALAAETAAVAAPAIAAEVGAGTAATAAAPAAGGGGLSGMMSNLSSSQFGQAAMRFGRNQAIMQGVKSVAGGDNENPSTPTPVDTTGMLANQAYTDPGYVS